MRYQRIALQIGRSGSSFSAGSRTADGVPLRSLQLARVRTGVEKHSQPMQSQHSQWLARSRFLHHNLNHITIEIQSINAQFKGLSAFQIQETRRQLFVDFLNSDKDFKQVEAKFEARLMESQRTQVRYGFRNDQWLIKNHGQRKAEKIMARKKQLGLRLGEYISFGYHSPQMYLWIPKATHQYLSDSLCSRCPASSNPQLQGCFQPTSPHTVSAV